MKKISYGINYYHKTASIIIEFANPLIFLLDGILEIVCGYLIPSIPLPNFDIVRDGERTTIREYYGDLQSLFHCYIHSPIFEYCGRKIDIRIIKVDYDKVRKTFYDKDKKFWDEHEESVKEIDKEE